MSQAGIAGMRAAADDLFEIARSLDDTESQTPSAAAGWSVQDVISHIGCLLELLQAAVRGDAVPDSAIEPLNEVMVAERRDWDTTRTLQNVQNQLEEAISLFIPLQGEPTASVEIPMLDLGIHPLHSIADMFVFDMTAHLRYDVLAPRGPINRQLTPLDNTRLEPSVRWLLGGVPTMQPDLPRHLTAPLALHLTGPGAQNVLISNADGAITVEPLRSTDQLAATLTSTTADFLAWSTTRLPWRKLVTVDGDHRAATEFLDAINLV
jgi:Mycothiol maleylpyruvate isomerase N-terminal domain